MMKNHYRVLVIVICVLIRLGYLSGRASKILFQLVFLKTPLVPDKWTCVDVETCDVCLDCFSRLTLGLIFTTPLLYCVSGVERQSIPPRFLSI